MIVFCDKIVLCGPVVQRIGHIPSKDTMLVRFQPGLPYSQAHVLIFCSDHDCSRKSRISFCLYMIPEYTTKVVMREMRCMCLGVWGMFWTL